MKKDEIIKWVVGIVLVIYMIFQLYVSFSFSSSISEISDNLDDIMAPYKVYEQQESSIENLLSDKGYEILSISMFNYTTDSPFYEWYGIEPNTICENPNETCYTDDVAVRIEMKSFGSRSEQIWDALTSSNVVFPNAYVHWITIKSPTDKCEYTIFGVRQYFESYDPEVHDLIQQQIDEYGKCS